MCGIYASVGFAPDPDRIDRVAYRGPDGRGWRQFASPAGEVALGHRRLAIIDVSDAGIQPMSDPSGRYHLIFNGEIYNYIELREELRAAGEVFRTGTDGEVLLRAYAVWGEAALNRLRGMFAFVIWDERDKTLFAARDRFGIKPLYMTAGPNGVAFASEIKQLIGLGGAGRAMNLARVHDFLAHGLSDHTGETMFAGVTQLRGGECVTVAASGRNLDAPVARRWYALLDPGATVSLSESEAAERFRGLLTDAVRLHLRSDVAIGSCLSGGLDSSSIVCLMARMLAPDPAARVNTVSACYPGQGVDERAFIDTVVERVGATAHFVFPRAEDVMSRAAEITWHQDEPFGSTSIFAQWCVFEGARAAGVKVMLDGQGADEQLAGYHWSFPYHLADLLRSGRWAMLGRALSERRSKHGASIGREFGSALLSVLPPRVAAALRRSRVGAAEQDWLDTDAFRPFRSRPSGVPEAVALLGLPPITDIASLCFALTYCSNMQTLLHWEDRNSMAHSIEARVPFVDHPLVEFSLSLGGNHKIVGADTKRVLRKAMSGILPDTIRDRHDKIGFATPEQSWFRGPLKGAIHDGVEATLARFPGLLDAAATRKVAHDMLEGRRPTNFLIWRIVNLGLWGERFGLAA